MGLHTRLSYDADRTEPRPVNAMFPDWREDPPATAPSWGEVAAEPMRTVITAATAALAVVALPAAADGKAKDLRPDCSAKLLHSANHHRHIVVKRHGKRAPDGTSSAGAGSDRTSARTLFATARSFASTATSSWRCTRRSRTRAWSRRPCRPRSRRPELDPERQWGVRQLRAIPEYIVQCESGGRWDAYNPSGASGPYQIMPDTAAAYGCDMSTHEGRIRCAAEIYADAGAAPLGVRLARRTANESSL